MIRYAIGLNELHRGRIKQAREFAHELMRVGQQLGDPLSTGFGLWLLTLIALVSDSYAEALEYSEQSLAVALTPLDKNNAISGKACALILLQRTNEGATLLEKHRSDCAAIGDFYALNASDGILGVCKVLQGNFGQGIHWIEDAILRREKEGYRGVADWYRMTLSEVFLQIIAAKETPPLKTLLKNLPTLVKVMFTAYPRIVSLMTRVLDNPQFDPSGLHVGHAKMLLGLLYKSKKKHALAVKHLQDAKEILVQFGQTPILARVETALAELE